MNDDIKNICDAKPISIQDLRPPKQYLWKPRLDITTYELALAIPILFYGLNDYAVESIIDSVPEGVKRHFEEV